MASYVETITAVTSDPAHVATVASATTAVQTEVPCDGGMVRITFIPAGAPDPVAIADATLKTQRGTLDALTAELAAATKAKSK